MRWETKGPFLFSTEILGFLSIFKKSQSLSDFVALKSKSLSRCQGMWGHLSRWRMEIGFPLGSPHRIQTSLHLVRWKTSLHSSLFREIWPYFFQGISVSTPLEAEISGSLSHTYLVREGCSSGACLNLALLFNRILGISSLLETIWGAWSFPRVPVLKFVFL